MAGRLCYDSAHRLDRDLRNRRRTVAEQVGEDLPKVVFLVLPVQHTRRLQTVAAHHGVGFPVVERLVDDAGDLLWIGLIEQHPDAMFLDE